MFRGMSEDAKRIVSALVIGATIALSLTSTANADLVTGPAIPVPGLSPNPNPGNEDFNWISADGHSMLAALRNFPDRRIAQRTLDAQTGAWSAPVEIGIGPEASGAWPSPDGNTMYYYTGDVAHIHRSHWDGSSWSAGELVPNVNTQYGGACPVFNGQRLYSSTTFDGDWGNYDIAVSDYDGVADEFSASEPIFELNSAYDDILTWISPDGGLVLFASKRPGGYGDFDLYSAIWDNQLGLWSQITNLGPEVNTAADERAGRIATDAGLLFFRRRALDSLELTLMQTTVIPEPSSLSLLAVAGLGLLPRRR